MKVKIKLSSISFTNKAGERTMAQEGDVIELTKAHAEQLIKNGWAVAETKKEEIK